MGTIIGGGEWALAFGAASQLVTPLNEDVRCPVVQREHPFIVPLSKQLCKSCPAVQRQDQAQNSKVSWRALLVLLSKQLAKACSAIQRSIPSARPGIDRC